VDQYVRAVLAIDSKNSALRKLLQANTR
jgi:hypothetical protein